MQVIQEKKLAICFLRIVSKRECKTTKFFALIKMHFNTEHKINYFSLISARFFRNLSFILQNLLKIGRTYYV